MHESQASVWNLILYFFAMLGVLQVVKLALTGLADAILHGLREYHRVREGLMQRRSAESSRETRGPPDK